jgi:gamma-tubulin complex component 4
MYHEILLALCGHPGDIFVEQHVESTGSIRYQVAAVDFLHPSERELLQRFANIGATYSQLQAFVDDVLYRGGGARLVVR